MSTDFLRRSTGVFNETETRGLRDAFLLALHSLATTQQVDEAMKARLADIILNLFMTESVPDQRHLVDTSGLAARSVERYLSLHKREQIRLDVTLH